MLGSLFGETSQSTSASPRQTPFEASYRSHVDERHDEMLRRLAEERGVPGASRYADYELKGGFLPLRYAAEVLGQSQQEVVEQVERGLLQATDEAGSLYVQPAIVSVLHVREGDA